ncbi:MAG: mdlB [Rhodocyclaceae bacterium]|nr:mdlB [Rhodocyclaceae bacterium]
MTAVDFQLARNPIGRLVLTTARGENHEGVVPVRAFPIAAPEEGIALVSPDGHEIAWVDRLADLPAPIRALVEEELASREFVPEIRRIHSVSSFATPSTWAVETDRGDTRLVLKGEEDIRRLSQETLLIADANGIQFLIRDLQALDKTSRRFLDRFL